MVSFLCKRGHISCWLQKISCLKELYCFSVIALFENACTPSLYYWIFFVAFPLFHTHRNTLFFICIYKSINQSLETDDIYQENTNELSLATCTECRCSLDFMMASSCIIITAFTISSWMCYFPTTYSINTLS